VKRVNQQGDVAVYIAVVMLMIMLSSTIVLSGILARQIRLTIDTVDTEKAFYAADTALEEGRYGLSKLFLPAVELENREIMYDDGEIAYYDIDVDSVDDGDACGIVEGRFRRLKRRLSVGAPGCR